MRTSSNYALRLPASLKRAVEEVARQDGTTLNQFIVSAVAEKLTALKTADYFAKRASRADFRAFDRLMRPRRGEAPQPGENGNPRDADWLITTTRSAVCRRGRSAASDFQARLGEILGCNRGHYRCRAARSHDRAQLRCLATCVVHRHSCGCWACGAGHRHRLRS